MNLRKCKLCCNVQLFKWVDRIMPGAFKRLKPMSLIWWACGRHSICIYWINQWMNEWTYLYTWSPFITLMGSVSSDHIVCQVTSVMSDSVRPYRQQPTRLPHPWDSPGKNTGVGCHFLLQCIKVKNESAVTQSCLTLSDPMDCSPPGSSVHGIFQARVLEWSAIAFFGSHCIGRTKYPVVKDHVLTRLS